MESFHDADAGQTVALPHTRWFDLPGPDDALWRLFLHVPTGEAPAGGWPLLAITDGNAVIATAVDALRVQSGYPKGTNVGPGVIAAIGYPVDEAYDPLRRSFDLSPPPGRTYPPFFADTPPVRTGGADRFLGFVEQTVLPFVETLAPIDPARRTLFGHSFGGLFALYVLFGGGTAFSRFVAASPTIYWEDALLLEAERRFLAEPPERDIVVHLSAGEYEGATLAPFQYGREDTKQRLAAAGTARTLELTLEMAERLAQRPRTRVHCETYAGETHMTLLPVAVSRAVRIAFAIEAG